MFFLAHRDLPCCRKGPGTPGRSYPFSGISYEKIVQKKDYRKCMQSARSARKCRAGFRTDARAQSNDGECTMKPVFDVPGDETYRVFSESNPIIHDMAGRATGAGPVFGRVPGVDG